MEQKKILLIEDDPFLGKLYTDLLTGHQFLVTAVTDGEQALEKIKQGGWDLILLDVILPKMNGVEIIEKIKNDSPDKLSQKIIFMTNLENNTLMDQIKITGFPYLSKSSLNPDEFLKKIHDYLV